MVVAPVKATWAGRRWKSLRRMGQVHISGVDLWKDCRDIGCGGIVIALNPSGRVLDTPAVMARVRDWPIERQVRLRLTLMARSLRDDERITAVRCDSLVWARLSEEPLSAFGESPGYWWFDFATGEWDTVPVTRGTALDCRLQRAVPARRR